MIKEFDHERLSALEIHLLLRIPAYSGSGTARSVGQCLTELKGLLRSDCDIYTNISLWFVHVA